MSPAATSSRRSGLNCTRWTLVVDRFDRGTAAAHGDQAGDLVDVVAHHRLPEHSAAATAASHQRRSCAHGPAHATSAPPPRGARRTARPRARQRVAPARDRDRRAVGVEQLGGHRRLKHACGAGPGTPPGHGASGRGRRVDGLGARLAPRHPAAPARAGVRPPAGTAVATASMPSIPCTRASARPARSPAAGSPPQNPSCRPTAGHHLVGHEPQQRDAARDDVVDVVGRDPRHPAATQPPLELPAHARHQRRGVSAPSWRQHLVNRSPCSVSASTTTRLHDSPRSSSRLSIRSATALAAKAASSTCTAGGSSSTVSTSSGGRAGATRPCTPSPHASRCAWIPGTPKRAKHRRFRERGEGTERAQPEPHEQVGELGPARHVRGDHADRPWSEERGRTAGRAPRSRVGPDVPSGPEAPRAGRRRSPSPIPTRTSTTPASRTRRQRGAASASSPPW